MRVRALRAFIAHALFFSQLNCFETVVRNLSLMNILLTAIGGPSGICFRKSLSSIPDVRVIGTTADDDAPPYGATLYRVPLAYDPGYIPAIENIIENESIDLIIPLVDEEMCVLSERSADLKARLLVSPATTIRYTSNKAALYDILADVLPQRFDHTQLSRFPLFAKPAVGRGGKGGRIIRSAKDAADLGSDYVIQELLEGPEISIDTLFDFDGKLVAAVPRVRARIDHGISVTGEVIEGTELIEVVQSIATHLAFIGPVNFQFMRGENGYKLLEINARGSGGMGITINSGVDIPRLAYELVRDGSLSGFRKPKLGTYNNFSEVIERQRQKAERESKDV